MVQIPSPVAPGVSEGMRSDMWKKKNPDNNNVLDYSTGRRPLILIYSLDWVKLCWQLKSGLSHIDSWMISIEISTIANSLLYNLQKKLAQKENMKTVQ